MLKKKLLINNISKLFKKLDIRKGSRILMHSNSAGLYQFNVNVKLSRKIFFDKIIDTIGRNGQLILPVYNYDFTRKKVFYFNKYNCQVGELGNFFLKNYNTYRSSNPVFSHAIMRGKIKLIYNDEQSDCLGKNSFFKNFYDYNFKIFGFCSAPTNSMTFIHHVEAMNKVKYRYDKKFTSFIVKNKKEKKTIIYNVGKKSINYDFNNNKIRNFLKRLNSFKLFNFGRFECWTVDAKEVYNKLTIKIKKKQNYLII
tara:strand:+ start:306 stop:1067 length:762 start_codon:yes stop_codon:yes gene_type:complete